MNRFYGLDFSKSVSARQKLETQVTENKIVKEVTQLFLISVSQTVYMFESINHLFFSL